MIKHEGGFCQAPFEISARVAVLYIEAKSVVVTLLRPR